MWGVFAYRTYFTLDDIALIKFIDETGYGDPEEKEKDDVPPYDPPKLPKHLREEHQRRLSKVDANVSAGGRLLCHLCHD